MGKFTEGFWHVLGYAAGIALVVLLLHLFAPGLAGRMKDIGGSIKP